MHKRLAAATVGALLLIAALAGWAGATLKVKCDVGTGKVDVATFVGRIDPIVNHNSTAPSAHQHDFFGTKGWQAAKGNSANYADLRASATICREAGDTAGYWAPSLVYISGPRAGQRVPVRQFTAYYRGFASQTTHAGSRAHPADTRLIAEDNVGFGLSGWTCGQNSTVTGSGRNSIPDCTGSSGTAGDTLTAHVNFPSCWNGRAPGHSTTEAGDTRDNADYVYPTSKTACPATHPYPVAQLRETIQYHYTGNGTDVRLTSDLPGQPNGSSYHVDFWNTWDQARYEALIADCVQTSQSAQCDK